MATSPIPTSSHVEKTKFCWGDLENEDPLGAHSHINSVDINVVGSWYDEGESPLDYEILKTIPKTHPKKSTSNQTLDRYPKRVRAPTVRFNL